MTRQTSILALLVFVAALSGCNMANAPNSTANQQIGGEENKAAREQDSQTMENQREALRLANDRIKLLEERAAFEKEKRELAEQQLKAEQERNSIAQTEPEPEQPVRQYESNHASQPYKPPAEPAFTWITWTCDSPPPEVGAVVKATDGVEYVIIGRQGNNLRGVPVQDG